MNVIVTNSPVIAIVESYSFYVAFLMSNEQYDQDHSSGYYCSEILQLLETEVAKSYHR